MFLALGAFAVVVGAGCRVRQGRERGTEHGLLETFVSGALLVFSVDGGTGAVCARSQAGVDNEVSRGRERAKVTDLQQNLGPGPDPDAGHRRQGRAERVAAQSLLELRLQVGSGGHDLK